MARFHGTVGFGQQGEVVDGVWSDTITERDYTGDLLSATKFAQQDEQVNDNIRLSNRIEIVADAFANENFSNIRYVEWAGTAWSVTSVEIRRPRLLLTLGGVYNGPRPA